MRKILTFLTVCVAFQLNAQSDMDTSKWAMEIYDGDTIYYRKPSLGDKAREAGELEKAIVEYKKIYADDPTDKENMYNMACTYALKRQNDSAFHYLNIAVAEDTNVFALNDPDFYFLMSDPRWQELEDATIKKIEAKFGEYKNKELSKELWQMKIKDQAFYYHLEVAEQKGGRTNPTIRALWELKHLINEENLGRLEEIIAEIGWPKASVVGGNAASTVFLVIQHADLETQKKYLPMMTEAADAGEADWASLALLIDRVNLGEGKKQVYGSQIGRNEAGEFYVLELEDPEYVNQRRKKVGLSPIEQYVSNWGIEWTIEQKEK